MKIASDSAAFSIPLADVQATTIASLVTLRPPAPLTNTTPRTMPIETTVYQLTNVRLVQAYEEHDNDYHLVLSDNAGHTMIAEVPQPSCALTSAVYNGILAVRSALNTQFPKLINGVNVTPNVSISVQGIGFWDTLNGTSGQAPNGIEIHPLTTICFGTNCTLNPQT